MVIYVALLRGINVGGKNIIKMGDLKKVLERLGLGNVQTYIQSGNVLFKSDEGEQILKKKIEYELEAAFGFPVPVVLRTAEELENIILNCPFTNEQILEAESMSDSESLYVSLLSHSPLQEKVELLKRYKNDTDEYSVRDREVYLLFKNSIRNSKLANNLGKLEVPSTVRNWKTINKLDHMAKEIHNKS